MSLTISTYNLLQELDDFSYSMSSSDRVWNILCPAGSSDWSHLRVTPFITWEPLPLLKPKDV